MNRSFGNELRSAVDESPIFPLIGVYDVFSATIAAEHFDVLFVSGFGLATTDCQTSGSTRVA